MRRSNVINVCFAVAAMFFMEGAAFGQDLRQWMPSVGDVYYYDVEYFTGGFGNHESGTLIDTCTVIEVDVQSGSDNPHAVIVASTFTGAQTRYYYSEAQGVDGYPIKIRSLQRCKFEGDSFTLDFSQHRPDTVALRSESVQIVRTSQNLGGASSKTYSASFAPSLGWFVGESYDYMDINGSSATWSRSLRSKEASSLAVGKKRRGLVENGWVTVYPNPVGSRLSVSGLRDSHATYEIRNVLGQVVKSGELLGTSDEIPVSELGPQSYWITIRTGTRTYRSSFVKY